MEKVVQDFQFHKFGAQYGRFLIAVADMAPKAMISDVSFHYDYKDPTTIRVSVDVPHDIAMLLKLQFSQELVKRPPPKPKEDSNDYISNLKNITLVKYRNNKINNDYLYDFENIKINKIKDYVDEDIEMYTYLKEYSKSLFTKKINNDDSWK